MTSVSPLVREHPIPVVPPAPRVPFDLVVGPLREIVTDWQLSPDLDQR